jgi:hypothetical protein
MEYYTSEEQEKILYEVYMKSVYETQDRIVNSRGRSYSVESTKEPNRIFHIENKTITLCGMECPSSPVENGRTYSIDYDFVNEVTDFLKRHKKYMIVFYPNSHNKIYKSYYGDILPATLTGFNEELRLENPDKYVLDF